MLTQGKIRHHNKVYSILLKYTRHRCHPDSLLSGRRLRSPIYTLIHAPRSLPEFTLFSSQVQPQLFQVLPMYQDAIPNKLIEIRSSVPSKLSLKLSYLPVVWRLHSSYIYTYIRTQPLLKSHSQSPPQSHPQCLLWSSRLGCNFQQSPSGSIRVITDGFGVGHLIPLLTGCN